MDAFVLTALFSVIEMGLIFVLIRALDNRRKGRAALIILFKLITYAVAVWLVFFKYSEFMVFSCCGYITGIPVGALMFYIFFRYFYKK